ncbi:MAG: phytanoyl-CoA dioxygenase family protein [Burkholderiaceae bacterium]
MQSSATAFSPPIIDSALRDRYQRDGVVVVRQAISPDWIVRMNRFAQVQLDAPSRWSNDQPESSDTGGRLFTDRYLWRTHDDARAFAFESGVAALVGQLMGSQTARLYFDHLLIKEARTLAPTPWHQDVPYWPFEGRQIASAWVALTDATVEGSAMEFVRGSHADGRIYRPEVFGSAEKSVSASWQTKSEAERVPAIEANRSAFDITGWGMRAGDAVVFSAWVLHGARGNASAAQRRVALSTRWLGDDAIWAPTEGTDPTVTQADVCMAPGMPAHDDDRFPLVWQAR